MRCADINHRISRFSMSERRLIKLLFLRHWHENMSFLQTAQAVLDFRHKCIIPRNTTKSLGATDVQILVPQLFLETRMSQANIEFCLCKQYKKLASRISKNIFNALSGTTLKKLCNCGCSNNQANFTSFLG